MRLFITGGAGYLGSAITRAFVEAGYAVTALARHPEHERRLQSLGAAIVRGDLREPHTYASSAAAADAIIHLAAPRDDDRESVGRIAVETLLAAARAGRPSHLIYASVLFTLGDTCEGADESTPVSGALYVERAELERRILDASEPGLVCSVVRPGMVYGGGNGGTVSELFRTAMAGRIQYVGDGANRWSLVHRDDLAALFRLIVENSTPGLFHATDGVPLRVDDVARHVAAAVGCADAERIPIAEARRVLGSFADALCLDQPVESPRARALGWTPRWSSFAEGAAAAFDEFRAEMAAEH